MGMIEAKTFTTGAEMYANAKAVRERMMNPVNVSSKLLERTAQEKRQLEQEVELLKAEIETHKLNIADLQGALLCQAHMLIDSYRQNDTEEGKIGRRSPRSIIEAVLLRDFPHVAFSDIIGPKRTRDLLPARQACMAAVYMERRDLSLPQIGRVFQRDHTTLIHTLQKLGVHRSQEGTA